MRKYEYQYLAVTLEGNYAENLIYALNQMGQHGWQDSGIIQENSDHNVILLEREVEETKQVFVEGGRLVSEAEAFYRRTKEMIDRFSQGTASAKDVDDTLKNSIVHVFYTDNYGIPVCQRMDNPAEWMTFDHTAEGTLCPRCRDKVNWRPR